MENVKIQSEERISGTVLWRTGSSEDELVEAKLNELLSFELTGADVSQIGLLNNYDLQATYENLGLAQSELVQAGLLSNPVLSMERRFKGQALELDVAQNFLSLVFLPMRKQIAQSAFNAAILEITQAVLDHVFSARASFTRLQSAEQQLELRQKILDVGEAASSAAGSLRAAGNITELQERTEKQIAAEAKLKLIESEMEVVELREQLNVVMGLSAERTSWKLVKGLPPLPPADIAAGEFQAIAIGSRPDLLALKQQAISKGQLLGLTNIESYIPELVISSHFEREPEGNSTAGPSIDIPIPIFDFGGARRGAALALLNQVKSRLKGLEVKIASEVRSAQGRMKVARARVDYLEQSLIPLQSKRFEQAQLHYNGMFLGVFELLHAKKEELESREELITSLRDYWLARNDLEQALGRELPLTANPVAVKTPLSTETHSSEHHHH